MKYKDKVYYSRLVTSIIGGVMCGMFKWNIENIGPPITLITLIYLLSVAFSVYLLKGGKVEKAVENPLKIVFLEGVGTFVINWLMIWIIVYNLLILLPLY